LRILGRVALKIAKIKTMDVVKIKNNLVVSSNDLVHAKYDLTLWQKRVFVYSISQLEKEDKRFESIKMPISDIIKFFKGSDGVKTYNAILEAPKNLDKTIEIPYVTDKGFLRYGFVNNDLIPHLLDLKEKFLKYDIANVIELQSTYSFRMFEILKSYEYRKTIELEIDYLRKILEVTTKYTSYKDFRIYIIDKAQQDLGDYCDISFTYEERKAAKGKKIESLVFHIQSNEPQKRDTKGTPTKMKKEKSTVKQVFSLFDESTETRKREKSTEEKTPITKDVKVLNGTVDAEKLVMELSPIVVSQFGVSLKVFMNLAEQHTEGAIRQAIQVTEKTVEMGKIDNIAGFFVEAVRGKYADPKQQKKQVEGAQKAKIVEAKRVEVAAEKAIETQKKVAYAQEITLFTQLIQQDKDLVQTITDKIRRGSLGSYYKMDKSFEENLKHPLLQAAFLSAVKEAKPESFGH
jgi:plasmid replication initiation protein